jgi:hypothetical protein
VFCAAQAGGGLTRECPTVFCLQAPASQPKNVIFGYLISSLVAAAVVAYLPHEYWCVRTHQATTNCPHGH